MLGKIGEVKERFRNFPDEDQIRLNHIFIVLIESKVNFDSLRDFILHLKQRRPRTNLRNEQYFKAHKTWAKLHEMLTIPGLGHAGRLFAKIMYNFVRKEENAIPDFEDFLGEKFQGSDETKDYIRSQKFLENFQKKMRQFIDIERRTR